jgi:hypothetical protein
MAILCVRILCVNRAFKGHIKIIGMQDVSKAFSTTYIMVHFQNAVLIY